MDEQRRDSSHDALRAHDPDACRRFVLDHRDRVYAFLAHLTSDRALAEELTLDVFAAAWCALPAFDGRASLATWLHRIAYTKFLDRRRADARRAARANTLAVRGVQPTPPSDPLDGFQLNEQTARLRTLLSQLSDEDRALVLLHYTQRMSYADIAIAVGEPEGTVKWRISKILKQLRERLMETSNAHA